MSETASTKYHGLVSGALAQYATLADVTATGSAARITASPTACIQVVVKALRANTTNVRVGDSSITTSRGYQLGPGEAVALAIDDVRDVYIIAESGSPVVSVLYAKNKVA